MDGLMGDSSEREQRKDGWMDNAEATGQHEAQTNRLTPGLNHCVALGLERFFSLLQLSLHQLTSPKVQFT